MHGSIGITNLYGDKISSCVQFYNDLGRTEAARPHYRRNAYALQRSVSILCVPSFNLPRDHRRRLIGRDRPIVSRTKTHIWWVSPNCIRDVAYISFEHGPLTSS